MKFRAHHFLCTLGFEGKGYSPGFVANYRAIAERLAAPQGDSEVIEVTFDSDVICEPCPNRRGEGCSADHKIRTLDAAHAAMLGLAAGQRLTWGEAKARIACKVTLDAFERACAPCSWKALGVCQKALLRLKGAATLVLSAWVLACPGIPPSAHAGPPASLKALVRAVHQKKYQALEAIPEKDRYFDHAQALLAGHEREQALAQLGRKRPAEAAALAKSSMSRWSRIQLAASSSPWKKRAEEEIGRAELIVARTIWARAIKARTAGTKGKSKAKPKLADNPEARAVFERAIDRIPLALVRWEDVDAYLASCGDLAERSGVIDSCLLWIRRLVGVFPKASVERKELESRWPAVFERLENLQIPGASGRIQQAYKVPDADQSAWDELLPLLRERSCGSLQEKLEAFLQAYPRSGMRQKARYWLALCYMDGGPDPKAFALFEQILKESPLSFYGLLSAIRLKRDPSAALADAAPEEEKRDPRLHPSELQAIEKAEALLDLKLDELAQMELREIKVRDTLDSDFLVYLAKLHQKAGSHLGAFGAVTELIQRGSPAAATRWAADVVFPVEYWNLIESTSKQNGIDPLWVLSLIKQESAFDTGALSSSGAVGLMQIMPATGVEVDPKLLRLELPDNERNVTIGTGYMAFLLKRFKGNIALATAGYNAGPVAVDRWLKEYGTEGGLGLLEFIESIPYRETRDYVGSIIRNYFWYSRRLESKPKPKPEPVELEYFWKSIRPQNESA